MIFIQEGTGNEVAAMTTTTAAAAAAAATAYLS